MKPLPCLFCLVMLLQLSAMTLGSFAQVRKDTLFLNNGELLIGELKEVIRGKATFKSDALSIVTVKAYKIRTMHTTIGTLRIETTDQRRLYGKLVPSASKDSIYVADELMRTELALKDINYVVAFQPNFLSQLDGTVSAGFSFSRSSSIGQFNLNGDVKHTTRWLQSELTVSELGSIDSSHFSLDQSKEQLSSYHYIKSSAWFADVGISHQRNVELSLAARYQGMVGPGYKFLAEQTINAFVLSGVAVSSEQSLGGQSPNGRQIEIPVVVKLDYFKYKQPNMQITMTNAAYFSLTKKGRFRYDGGISFSWELVSDFYLTTNLYGNYDNKPLDQGPAKVDYGLVLGITYKF